MRRDSDNLLAFDKIAKEVMSEEGIKRNVKFETSKGEKGDAVDHILRPCANFISALSEDVYRNSHIKLNEAALKEGLRTAFLFIQKEEKHIKAKSFDPRSPVYVEAFSRSVEAAKKYWTESVAQREAMDLYKAKLESERQSKFIAQAQANLQYELRLYVYDELFEREADPVMRMVRVAMIAATSEGVTYKVPVIEGVANFGDMEIACLNIMTLLASTKGINIEKLEPRQMGAITTALKDGLAYISNAKGYVDNRDFAEIDWENGPTFELMKNKIDEILGVENALSRRGSHPGVEVVREIELPRSQPVTQFNGPDLSHVIRRQHEVWEGVKLRPEQRVQEYYEDRFSDDRELPFSAKPRISQERVQKYYEDRLSDDGELPFSAKKLISQHKENKDGVSHDNVSYRSASRVDIRQEEGGRAGELEPYQSPSLKQSQAILHPDLEAKEGNDLDNPGGHLLEEERRDHSIQKIASSIIKDCFASQDAPIISGDIDDFTVRSIDFIKELIIYKEIDCNHPDEMDLNAIKEGFKYGLKYIKDQHGDVKAEYLLGPFVDNLAFTSALGLMLSFKPERERAIRSSEEPGMPSHSPSFLSAAVVGQKEKGNERQ
ncbi:MAG: hypothetical protein K0R25_1151 [Rickettsiaceae bacterium]|jgi:hypothetical protein|nr:hypothetical protein [Rickettsiaceae bacterium]